MNLDSVVKQGCLPWRPNAQASGLDVWHEYEVPLTGTFQMGSATVLFTMVLESERGLSVWAYVDLAPETSQSLPDKFDTVEALNTWVDQQFAQREAVLAFVRDGRIGSRWTRQRVETDLLDAVEIFVTDMISSVDEVSDPATRVRAKIAGIDAARSELVDRQELVEA